MGGTAAAQSNSRVTGHLSPGHVRYSFLYNFFSLRFLYERHRNSDSEPDRCKVLKHNAITVDAY